MDNDRADRTKHNKLVALEKQREREIDDALAALMQHPQGRRTIYWLLELGRTGGNPFTGNALTTAFACGELNIAKKIEARVIAVAPNFYLTMLKEMASERAGTDNGPVGDDTAGDDDSNDD